MPRSERSKPARVQIGEKEAVDSLDKTEKKTEKTLEKQKEKKESEEGEKAFSESKTKYAKKESIEELATCWLEDDYDNGVIFYLGNDEVVGIVLWNLSGFAGDPSSLDIARQVIADGVKDKSLTEVAKLFNVYAK